LPAIDWREGIIRAPTPFVVVNHANDQGATIGTQQYEHRGIAGLAR
jgi:hypothetical protein